MSPAAFARQLGYLQESGHVPVTAGQLISAMTAGDPASELPAKPVVLTFDDGFADFHDNALPLLCGTGSPATCS